ncbi:MAG: hypothetical protein ABI380_13530 [Edaphobacter sp.]
MDNHFRADALPIRFRVTVASGFELFIGRRVCFLYAGSWDRGGKSQSEGEDSGKGKGEKQVLRFAKYAKIMELRWNLSGVLFCLGR